MRKWFSYWKREVEVQVQYITENGVEKPEMFSIYVIQKNKTQMLTNLLWSEIDRIATQLEKQTKPIELWRSFGIGREVLTVPKWALKPLAAELRKVKQMEEKKIQSVKTSTFRSVLANPDEQKAFFTSSFFISGNAGTKKTTMIKEIIPKLIKEGRRVLLLDFRNEYEAITKVLNGKSFRSEEVYDKENSLVRIHFGEDVLSHRNEYDLSFLTELAPYFDTIVVDEASMLYQNHFGIGENKNLNIYDLCRSLLHANLSIQIILSVLSLEGLSERDQEALPVLFPHYLLLHQTLSDRMPVYDQKLLCTLESGEAIWYRNQKAHMHLMMDNK